MKVFLLRWFIFLAPLLCIPASFFILDPFKIIYMYDDYFEDYSIIINRDYVATEVYLQNKKKHKYDSFIFGSSRTLGFKTYDWIPYLDKNSSPLVYWSSGESIFGIWSKFKFLNEQNDTVKNALIVIDNGYTLNRQVNSTGHVYVKHYTLTGESKFSFCNTFLNAYVSDFFFVRYLDFLCFKKYRPYMKGFIDDRIIKTDPITNDFYRVSNKNSIMADSEKYYTDREHMFYPRDGRETEYGDSTIDDKVLSMLHDIQKILKSHNTNYEIVIGPSYNQIQFNIHDLKALQKIFGKDHVHDYTGINEFTADMHNYYDDKHYMPHVGKSILQEIYEP